MKSLVILAVFVASILSNRKFVMEFFYDFFLIPKPLLNCKHFNIIFFIAIAVNDRVHEANLRRILENQRYNFPCGWPNAGENGG